VWSVSLSAPCFNLLASFRYWFCWFWSLHTKHKKKMLWTFLQLTPLYTHFSFPTDNTMNYPVYNLRSCVPSCVAVHLQHTTHSYVVDFRAYSRECFCRNTIFNYWSLPYSPLKFK
jgi:hypothetical protein